MGRATQSGECAPDDKLCETHHLHLRQLRLMGIASLNLSYALYTIHAATWPRSRSRLSSVLAQASATSMPLVAKCLRKNSKCAAVSWNCCGVSTAENTGTSVRNCTSISALITVSETNSWR